MAPTEEMNAAGKDAFALQQYRFWEQLALNGEGYSKPDDVRKGAVFVADMLHQTLDGKGEVETSYNFEVPDMVFVFDTEGAVAWPDEEVREQFMADFGSAWGKRMTQMSRDGSIIQFREQLKTAAAEGGSEAAVEVLRQELGKAIGEQYGFDGSETGIYVQEGYEFRSKHTQVSGTEWSVNPNIRFAAVTTAVETTIRANWGDQNTGPGGLIITEQDTAFDIFQFISDVRAGKRPFTDVLTAEGKPLFNVWLVDAEQNVYEQGELRADVVSAQAELKGEIPAGEFDPKAVKTAQASSGGFLSWLTRDR